MRVAIHVHVFHKRNKIGYTNVHVLQFCVLELGEYMGIWVYNIWEMVSQCEKVRYLGWYN